MKRTYFIAVLIGLAAMCIFATDASAYYDPGTGRFLSRDPIGTNMPPVRLGAVEVGASGPIRIVGAASMQPEGRFIHRDQPSPSHYEDGPNLYQYVRSNPSIYIDPYGLSAEKCDKCGPESTGAVNGALARVSSDFSTWSWWTKQKKCASLYNVLPIPGLGSALSSWDLRPMPWVSGCATGKCEETIWIDGGCHSFWGVNYVLFGRMNRLCGYSKSEMLDTVGGYTLIPGKIKNRLSKLAWAEAGYDGWPAAKTPKAPRRYKDCQDCGKCYNTPMTYLWQPENPGDHGHEPPF